MPQYCIYFPFARSQVTDLYCTSHCTSQNLQARFLLHVITLSSFFVLKPKKSSLPEPIIISSLSIWSFLCASPSERESLSTSFHHPKWLKGWKIKEFDEVWLNWPICWSVGKVRFSGKSSASSCKENIPSISKDYFFAVFLWKVIFFWIAHIIFVMLLTREWFKVMENSNVFISRTT